MPLLEGVQSSSPAHHYYAGSVAHNTGPNAIAGPSGSGMNISPAHMPPSPKRYSHQYPASQQGLAGPSNGQQNSHAQQLPHHHHPTTQHLQQLQQQQQQYQQLPPMLDAMRDSNGYGMASSSQQAGASSGRKHSDASSSRYDPNAQQQENRQGSHMHGGSNTYQSRSNASASLTVPVSGAPVPTTAASLMREGPRDFTIIKAAGDGSFGTVSLADWKSPLPSGTMLSPMQHPTTRPEYVGKRLVAIKRMKKPFKSWNDCLKLKELKSLLDIPHHSNIIPLYDAFLDPSTKELHFVFECMEGNLYQLTKSRKGRPLAGGLVASIFKQIIYGLHHIHEHGYFHRDMKPENLLITTTGLDDYPAFQSDPRSVIASERDVIVIVKLADFGLARETASEPPYTEYVSTRWYRAPEVLLRSKDYSNPVDLWALGTILAELVNLKPLFPGDSEVDQILQICEVLGDPFTDYGTDSRGRIRGGGSWEGGMHMAAGVGFQWPKVAPVKFSSLFSSRVPIELIDCIEDLLRYDPAVRFTTLHCMRHPYLLSVAPRLQPSKESLATTVATKASIPPSVAVDPTAARQGMPPSHSNMPPSARPAFGEASSAVANSGLQQQQTVPLQRLPFYRPQQETSGDGHMGKALRQDDSSGAQPRHIHDPSSLALRDQYQPHPHSLDREPQPQLDAMNKDYNAGGQQNHVPSYSTNAETSAASARMDEASVGGRPTERRKGWGMTLSSVFSGNHSNTSTGIGANNAGYPQGLDPSGGLQSRKPSYSGVTPSENTLAPMTGGFGALGGMATASQIQPSQSGPGEVDPKFAQVGAPPDPKKAKKEAERVAKQNEKAKRQAQEKAARDRARAVMQKRNQIMSASDGREQVEWLSNGLGAAGDKGKAKQTNILANNGTLSPLESPRSAQPASGLGLPSIGPNGLLNPSQSNMSLFQQQYRSPTTSLAPQYSPGGPSARPFHSPTGPYSQMIMGAMRGAPRPGSVASYATNESDPGPYGGSRRLMAGHPGLNQRQGSASSLSSGLDTLAHSTGSYRFFVGSNDSLNRNEDVGSIHSLDSQLVSNMEAMTAAERTTGLRSSSPGAPHSHGIVAGGSNRPSSRQGRSTRSRASSIQRAGSASPLHHTSAPRFHPYGGGQGNNSISGPSPTGHHIPLSATSAQPPPLPSSPPSRTSSSQSYYSQFPLPPFNTEEDRRRGSRPKALRRPSSTSAPRPYLNSRGEVTTPGGVPYHPQHAMPYSASFSSGGDAQSAEQQQLVSNDHGHGNQSGGARVSIGAPNAGQWAAVPSHSVNPMWGSKGGQGLSTRLPPFSSLIAVAPEEDSDMTDGSGAPR
ncbi:hypothetical protein BCV69DRAFT_279516 [Microstroma glucosiphilum]|uniref:Protein kinase domain-containing protein n=1 Tax=Pseudomicrostroma glucosiphilum TaxID=1684307 RepID=A0A316UI28_9BASI|nr:hypothetical protein BCV69DRAFT_279516 [Pseudomicrostroma glucosiphilum]PWN23583.1 hypothetical protein BCV69DRAFT_279516 [Pseudomicrostroma glucosiphilum]